MSRRVIEERPATLAERHAIGYGGCLCEITYRLVESYTLVGGTRAVVSYGVKHVEGCPVNGHLPEPKP